MFKGLKEIFPDDMALKIFVHLTEGKRREDGADIWEFLKIFRHYHILNLKVSYTA